MTSIQHGLLRHTLGLVKRKSVNQNCIASGDGEDNFADIRGLVDAGFMHEGAKIPGPRGLAYYHATEAGVAAATLDYDACAALLALFQPVPDLDAAPEPAPWED